MRIVLLITSCLFSIFAQDSVPWVSSRDVSSLSLLAPQLSLGDEVIVTDVTLGSSNASVALDLTRFQVFRPDSKITIYEDGGRTREEAVPAHTYLSGEISELPGSHVVLVLQEDGEIKGFVSWESQFWSLGQGADGAIAATDVNEDQPLPMERNFACPTELLNQEGVSQARSKDNFALPIATRGPRSATYSATIAFESDHEFFQLFGNANAATTYIGQLVAFATTVYEAEFDTSMSVGEVFLWETAADPWVQSTANTICTLFEFGQYWNNNRTDVTRTAAHFLSARNFGGGVAWVDVLCRDAFNVNSSGNGCTFSATSNYGGDYGISGGIAGNFNPNSSTVVWDIVVTMHEIGHNFGSPHTHCYGNIGGSASPIDSCYTSEPSGNGLICATGQASLPSGCPGINNGCGTIMSYCHLVNSNFRDMTLTFGLNHPYGILPARVSSYTSGKVVTAAQSHPSCLSCALPVVTTDPTTQSACVGDQVSLTVVATGASSYQWRKSSQDIQGATSATLSFNGIKASDTGSYDCVVTNSCGTDTSNSASLTVNALTAISQSPSSSSVCVGDAVNLSVSATGVSLSYQWRKNSQNINNATSSTYAIASATANDAGSYDCVVTGTCGNATSTAATLTVSTPISFTTHPAITTACAGASVTFTVAVSGSNPTYQWQYSNQDIDGATSASYEIASVKVSDAGDYRCVVTNGCGSQNSNTATLSVNPGTSIVTDPSSIAVCLSQSATFSVTASGQKLSYQWRKNSQDINGANSANYNIPSVSADDAGSYDCVVSGTCGNTTSAAATLTVGGGVTLLHHPMSATRCSGSSVTFQVVAAEQGLNYQWRKNQSNIQGATQSSYTISAATNGDVGSYDCLVDDGCGAVPSNAATLTIQAGSFQAWISPAVAVQGLSDLHLNGIVDCGVGSLSYLWTDAQGNTVGTDATLVLSNHPSATTSYTFRVTDSNQDFRTATVVVLVSQTTLDPNGDGENTIEDLLLILPEWRGNNGFDANGDGIIDIRDLLFVPIP